MFKQRIDEVKKSVDQCVCTNQFFQSIDKETALDEVLVEFAEIKKKKSSVFIIGNGGSAGIASHFSIDLVNVGKIPAYTLYDSNQLTCIANDYGYEQVFVKPLQVNLQPDDLLVAISSSGKSANIVLAAEYAKQLGAKIITLSGFNADNPLRKIGEVNFWINSLDYGIVEISHFFLLHTFIDAFAEKKVLCPSSAK